MRNWKNNCNRDAKWLLSLPDKEMTQTDKKNTTFQRKMDKELEQFSERNLKQHSLFFLSNSDSDRSLFASAIFRSHERLFS